MKSSDFVYLGETTRIEPLCSRWFAWPHLVAPVQQSMNVAFRQIPLLESFISDPETHEAAAKRPEMVGAPIVNLTPRDVPRVEECLQSLRSIHETQIMFARDYSDFSKYVNETASGHDVSDYYAKLPESLAGLTEISYDLSNHPVVRLIDEMVHESPLARCGNQELMFTKSRDEDRDFFLSTPRLDREDRYFVPIAFDDQRLDCLSKSRMEGIAFSLLADELNIPMSQRSRFRDFFSSRPPTRVSPRYSGPGTRVRYFGHACVLVETRSVSVLIDPCTAWARDTQEATLTFADLPDFIDYVFITHGHPDHFCPEILLQLRGRVGTFLIPRNNASSIADPSPKLILRRLGFTNCAVLDPMDKVDLPNGYLRSVPFYGEHCDLNVHAKHGMFLTIEDRRFLFLADSSCIDPTAYQRIAPEIARLDALYIGMECYGAPLGWLYQPYLLTPVGHEASESRRLSGANCQRALNVVKELECKRAYPYAMGQEPWLKFLMGLQYEPDSLQLTESDKFVQTCRDAGIISKRLYGCEEMFL